MKLTLFRTVVLFSASLPAVQAQTTRSMNIYYGTLQVFQQGNPNPLTKTDVVQFTDHISPGLGGFITVDAFDSCTQCVPPDNRVLNALPLWTNNQTNLEWLFASPENLPAIANFNGTIAALPGTAVISTDSGFQLIDTKTYIIAQFDSGGRTVVGRAQVSFFRRDYSKTIAGQPSATPLPPSLILALTGLAGAGLYMARRKLARQS